MKSTNKRALRAHDLIEELQAWQEAEGEKDAVMLSVAVEAQTEATLAVASELRTVGLLLAANLHILPKPPGNGPDLVTLAATRLGLGGEGQ